MRLFDEIRHFFYITNDWVKEAEEIVPAPRRGQRSLPVQENLIQQIQGGQGFAAPVDSLLSNWAYMVMTSLAWNLKAWACRSCCRRRERRR